MDIYTKKKEEDDLEKHEIIKAPLEFNFLRSITDKDKDHREKFSSQTPNFKDRYSDIRPYEKNRVELGVKKEYINASWIHAPFDYSIIATQGINAQITGMGIL